MVSIASQFRTQKVERDDDQLLDLFRNRTALKQEFEKLRNESAQLKTRLEQQEGDVLRTRQQLEQLEGMLAQPEQAAGAGVYYQLKGVWHQGRKKLARLSAELLERYRNREAKLQIDQFNAKKTASLKAVNQDIRRVSAKIEQVSKEISAIEEQLSRSRWFWKKQRRNELQARLEVASSAHRLLTANLEKSEAQKEQQLSEVGPGFAELSTDSRRKINLTLIALAQELYIHFHGHDVGFRSRQAVIQQLGEVSYGDMAACRELTQTINEQLKSMPSSRDLYARARVRAARLKGLAVYRRESDTVPVAGSLSEILVYAEGKQTKPLRSYSVNVLVDEYWDLYSALVN